MTSSNPLSELPYVEELKDIAARLRLNVRHFDLAYSEFEREEDRAHADESRELAGRLSSIAEKLVPIFS
ncbi:hypothetical protein [Sansalvadorimonas verongulae]|uniref:hypothetical protein n=1 Tax=Sansalvadorimonas verongulae TaxID=2172824 RepID=UPI0012BC8ABB|nr:hypothetical protein [Sansalvadorimonas verongulae]MTI13250.1 hypothetical protein [Sansalvadorimonas verongulae]